MIRTALWMPTASPIRTDRSASGHGDPLGMVSVEVGRTGARLAILGAIPSVLALSPSGMVADDLERSRGYRIYSAAPLALPGLASTLQRAAVQVQLHYAYA